MFREDLADTPNRRANSLAKFSFPKVAAHSRGECIPRSIIDPCLYSLIGDYMEPALGQKDEYQDTDPQLSFVHAEFMEFPESKLMQREFLFSPVTTDPEGDPNLSSGGSFLLSDGLSD